MNKNAVLREGSKVEDFSMESLLGGAAGSCNFTCSPNICPFQSQKPVCQPNQKRLIEKPIDLTINLSF